MASIVAGKRGISADTAVRFAAYFGNSAEFRLTRILGIRAYLLLALVKAYLKIILLLIPSKNYSCPGQSAQTLPSLMNFF
jgi:hypothetical protein